MEKTIDWVTALIAAYRHLPRAVEACKKTSSALALSGFYNTDTMALVEKMIDCNVRAESYINAKVLVDGIVEKLPLKYARIVLLRARYGAGIEVIAEKLGYAKRSAFRWYAEALKKAASILKAQGHDSDWFSARYAKDVLIGDYYAQIRKGADVFGRTVKISDCKKIRIKLEDAVAAGLLLGERAASVGCLD